jgi:A/G-specific adenine glycosylase
MLDLQNALLAWYAQARRDLPWRRTRDPYAIWLSEVMLQQTRVETVAPYWKRFLDAYPTVHALAEAPLDGVLGLWSGLGYYRRARMLHAGARQIVQGHGGRFPGTAAELGEIQGIGRYTAGAVASIAFGQAAALVDGNVARVLARVFAVEEDVGRGAGLARIWRLAEALVVSRDPGSWNQALMELGATICVPKNPRCLVCPIRAACQARSRGIEGSLPVVSPKKPPKRERRVALVATRDERVLLGRRKPDGIFGGLWEPPLLDLGRSSEVHSRFEALVGGRLGRLAALGSVTHVLSHRRLEIEVVGATLRSAPARAGGGPYDVFELVAPKGLADRGFATLGRKILAVAKVE